MPAQSSSGSVAAPSIRARTSGWAATTPCSPPLTDESNSAIERATRSASASSPPSSRRPSGELQTQEPSHESPDSSAVPSGGGALRRVRYHLHGRIDRRVDPRRGLRQLSSLLHRYPEHRGHRRSGRALPAPHGAVAPIATARRRPPRWPARLAPHLVFLVPELLVAAGPFVITSTTRTGERPRFRLPDFFYGGQALIEGVMMRGRTTVAMSVRPPSGEIRTYSEPLPAALARGR